LLDFANTKTLDPRITFTRASTGTFYDGKTVAKAEENLFERSQEFDNAYWSKTAIDVTSNATTAPDGTTTADLVVPNGVSTNEHRFFRTFTNAIVTPSIYAKAAGYSYINITGSSVNVSFNLTTGTVASTQSGGTGFIQSVGNGWYRCWVVAAAEMNNCQFRIFAADNTASWGGNGTDGIYVWGAQLEQRSAATAYQVTTTAPITNYIPALQTAASGVPRFEHNPTTGESLGLEIEEQRTNLQGYSTFTTSWVNEGTTFTTAANIAPDGTQTAIRVSENTATSTHAVYYGGTNTISGSTTYTYSVYAKASGRSFLSLQINEFPSVIASWVSVNLTNGSVGSIVALAGGGLASASAAATAVGNGWYRCTLTWTSNAGSTAIQPYIGPAFDAANRIYAGNGFSGVFLWGAMLEVGAFASGYIPTVASQVTRSADEANITGANFSSWWSRPYEAIYVEGQLSGVTSGSRAFVNIRGGAVEGRVELRVNGTTPTIIVTNSNGSLVLNTGAGAVTANTTIKMAAALQTNDIAFYVNGTQTAIGSSLNSTPTGETLVIGAYAGSLSALNGTINKIAYYPKRLTNAELQGMTTI
jgi:hypothetical protein